ncbi:MAG TPA: NAD(P)-binding domain-containing protein [Trebonia sp.]|nr:NAD(P)-binding domain-containing protein [Trebonia sp.]
MQIAIIGGGKMGRGIATRALAGQHAVRIIDKDEDRGARTAGELRDQRPGADIQAGGDEAIAAAGIVVLAVRYPVTTQVAGQYARALDGKIVIDIANPGDWDTYDHATTSGTSAAEEVATQAPRARVVKAFNTTFAASLMDGHADGQSLDVFIASDDAPARKTVAEFASSAGLHPVDVGPLRHSRALEAFQILHMSLQQDMPSPWHSAIKIVA